jgi:hypothetical protein
MFFALDNKAIMDLMPKMALLTMAGGVGAWLAEALRAAVVCLLI